MCNVLLRLTNDNNILIPDTFIVKIYMHMWVSHFEGHSLDIYMHDYHP